MSSKEKEKRTGWTDGSILGRGLFECANKRCTEKDEPHETIKAKLAVHGVLH